jgi:Nif-specific regulatory protein
MPMQTKLLRTLQEGTLTRLGGKSEIKISVRVVAATNRDLAHEVNMVTLDRIYSIDSM